MPAVVVRASNGDYLVKSHAGKDGKVLGRHPSKPDAQRQAKAVNASLSRAGKI